jgi:hypothetical protein
LKRGKQKSQPINQAALRRSITEESFDSRGGPKTPRQHETAGAAPKRAKPQQLSAIDRFKQRYGALGEMLAST